MQESVQHISQSLRAGAGKIRRGKSYRTNNKYSGKKQNQQSGMFFFYPSFSANQRSQITAEIFNRAHGKEQHEENHANLVEFQPGDFLIKQQTDSTGTHISKDGAVAHIGLKEIKCIGEKSRGNVRNNSMHICLETGNSHGAKGQVRLWISCADVLISQLCHNGKGIQGNCKSTGKGSKPEQKCGGQRQNQCRKRAENLDENPENSAWSCRKFQVCRGKGSSRNGEKRSQYGTSHRHLYGIKKGQKDFSDIGKIWWDHVCHKIGKMAPALPEGSEVTASKPGSQEKQKEEAYWNRPSFGIVYNAAFVHGSHLIFPDCVFRVGVDLFCNFLSQLCCFPIKYNFPILKPNKPLGKLPGKFQIMTVHQNGHTFCLMNASQELKNLPPSHRVQRSDRFICQQNTWVTHQGSCNGSTLFLTAGKVFHWLLCLVKKSYPVQKLQSFRFAIFSIKPQHTGEKSKVRKAGGEHIFQAGGILHKTKILINGSNGCLKAALLPAVQRLEGDSIQKNLSAGAGEHSV